MAIVITCSSRKGGIGKSSINYEICSIFSSEIYKYKCLLISTDDQCDMDLYVNVSNENNPYTFLDVIRGNCSIEDAIFKTDYNFDMIRSDKAFSRADREFVSADDFYLVNDCIEFIQDKYDFIIFDSCSNRGFINTSILMSANYVFCSSYNDEGSLSAITEMQSDIVTLKKRRLSNVKILGLVLNRAENTVEHKETDELLDMMAKELNCKHFTKIRKSIKLDRAKKSRKPVSIYDKWSDIAIDFRKLSSEIIDAIAEDMYNE